LSEKNATVSGMKPVQINITLIMIIVSTAPVNIRKSAVPSILTPYFEDRRFRDFLNSMKAIMENTNSTTKEIIIPVRAVPRALLKRSSHFLNL